LTIAFIELSFAADGGLALGPAAVDENVPEERTQLLRDAGLDSASIVEQHLGDADDLGRAKRTVWRSISPSVVR